MTENAPDQNEVMLVAGAIIRPEQAAEAARLVSKDDISDPRLGIIWGAIMKLISIP